jgi:hypothetical protein
MKKRKDGDCKGKIFERQTDRERTCFVHFVSPTPYVLLQFCSEPGSGDSDRRSVHFLHTLFWQQKMGAKWIEIVVSEGVCGFSGVVLGGPSPKTLSIE